MADDNTATTADDTEQQITFNVKSSADAKYVVTVSAAITVGDLKQKLSTSEYADLPPERQRLIYSGRVLKDADTLGSCKIKDGNTVHLVKGAESNQRQNPANQGGAAAIPSAPGQPASNVPTNIAAGSGTGNPLAQLTGARFAGFHGLPGAETFGADGGMGAPPNPDQMLRMLDDPNFAQQMNEAMNNPAVLDMLRNNPMIRNNPMARAAIENPEMRRMMMDPNVLRMQMNMQRAMGGAGAGGDAAFPMPGQTDTTEGGNGGAAQGGQGANPAAGAAPSNPFAALFPGAGGAGTTGAGAGAGAAPDWGSLFGGGFPGAGAGTGAGVGAGAGAGVGAGTGAGAAPAGQQNPFSAMTQQLMQNPEMMQQMMQAMGGGAGGEGGMGGMGGFNPGMFGMPSEPAAPADTRPPEERYESQLRQLNDMGFYEFDRNVQALRRSGGSVQGAIEYLLQNL
ncbi:deubiquitination-protection protein dph1 [Zymoseptoria brevis]|uniref:Deubiquitination-protection protein dph1 n=1 Tax=Zymoseptoria brevis TaxID=1047168 RepID=A0A0F4G743_9PEZI|nr:deubiquitination-protection protein dph1 [Zymoseptoria brevis]